MSEGNNALFNMPVHSIDEAGRLIGHLFDVARTDAVFGEPLTQGETTVIVASAHSSARTPRCARSPAKKRAPPMPPARAVICMAASCQ